MNIKQWFTKKRLLQIAVFGVFYVSLWWLTHVVGAPQVREMVLKIPATRGDEDGCYARAYAPFIVRADYQFGHMFNGSGGGAIYFWAFGRTFKIVTVSYWVS